METVLAEIWSELESAERQARHDSEPPAWWSQWVQEIETRSDQWVHSLLESITSESLDSPSEHRPSPVWDPQATAPRPKPARTEEVRTLPTVTTTEVGTCSICLDDWPVGTEVRQLPCGHQYHPKCVDRWLQQDHRCPVCRHSVSEASVPDPSVPDPSVPAPPTRAAEPVESAADSTYWETSIAPERLYWNLDWDLAESSQADLLTMVSNCWGLPYRAGMTVSEIQGLLQRFRSRWLASFSMSQLLRLTRDRYPTDPTYRGMERSQLHDLLLATREGRHLEPYSVGQLVGLARRLGLGRRVRHSVERADLVRVLRDYWHTQIPLPQPRW
jgi:hypothetical protein